jgi:hypothetical protein
MAVRNGLPTASRKTSRRAPGPRTRRLTHALYGLIAQLLSEIARDWSRCPRAACRRRRRCCGAHCYAGRFLRQPEIRQALRPTHRAARRAMRQQS